MLNSYHHKPWIPGDDRFTILSGSEPRAHSPAGVGSGRSHGGETVGRFGTAEAADAVRVVESGGSAGRKFDTALGLWRGPAYADVGDAAWAAPEVARLEELRLSVVEGRH
ncbi:MAG: BTAD domain-containing putative transcriptional regulator [Pseudonocardiaceae bacterium]